MKRNKNLVFGIRAVIEAIKSGKSIEKIYIKRGLHGELIKELYDIIKKDFISYQHVPIEKLNRLTSGNHQGVVGYISLIEYYKLEDIIPIIYEQGEIPFILILDRVSDVRNFGAVCRVAECAGIHAIVIPEEGSAQINADAIKTSAGALHHLKVVKTKKLYNTIKYLKNSGLNIISASEKSDELYYNIKYTEPTAIILGSEEKGISSQLLKLSESIVKIPVLGNISSLNIATAASVIIYEAVKQRITSIN